MPNEAQRPSRVIADITVSLDGFVTGPGPGPGAGLGDGGMQLHDWVFQGDELDQAVLAATVQRTGAVVMGRNVFDVVDAADGWSTDIGYGAHHVGRPPFFVVTHHRPRSVRLDLDFTFVTDGVAAAVAAACATCPAGKDVVIMGGGNVIAQAISLDVVDEVLLHVSPIVMGAGTPLWHGLTMRQFHQTDVRASPYATHITLTTARRD